MNPVAPAVCYPWIVVLNLSGAAWTPGAWP